MQGSGTDDPSSDAVATLHGEVVPCVADDPRGAATSLGDSIRHTVSGRR